MQCLGKNNKKNLKKKAFFKLFFAELQQCAANFPLFSNTLQKLVVRNTAVYILERNHRRKTNKFTGWMATIGIHLIARALFCSP